MYITKCLRVSQGTPTITPPDVIIRSFPHALHHILTVPSKGDSQERTKLLENGLDQQLTEEYFSLLV